MRRRDFLTASLSTSAMTFSGQAWSAPDSDQRLLVIFLRGGYDAINIVIPTASDFYYKARPTIAIARPDPANPRAALPLDHDWSLHPALGQSIYPLWQKKQAAFIPFAGSDDLTRSHFESQDTIELGQPVNRRRNYRSGFMSRLAEQLSSFRPISFTAQPPLTFQGASPVPNIAVLGVNKPGLDQRQSKLILDMYKGRDLERSVLEGFSVRDKAYSSLAGEMIAANRNALSPSGFELAARRIGRMMRSDYNLAFLDVGGWDTHVNQGGATGILADRIGQLGLGIAGIADELGDAWPRTTMVVVSEFGRTVRENGDRGTDHGHGSVYWLLGGSLNEGGSVTGKQVPLTAASLNEQRDLPVLNDYRSILSGIVRRLYSLDEAKISRVFPV